MLNIPDLEKRWFRYKVKSYIPHVSIFISVIVIVSIILAFRSNTQVSQLATQEPLVNKEILKVQKPLPITVQVPVVNPEPKQIVNVEPKTLQTKGVKLSPSLGFMRNMQSSIQPYYQDNTKSRQEPVYQVQEPKVEIVRQEEVIVPEHIVPVKVQKISIKRQNTQNDIYEIIKRFKKNNNPALSLFVAKKYYELGNYQQAYNYALITNKINKGIESSWIIFTKSLVKLGKRDRAIQILKKYIQQSHSSGAQILLDEIYAGKFK